MSYRSLQLSQQNMVSSFISQPLVGWLGCICVFAVNISISYALAVMQNTVFRNGCIINFKGGDNIYAMISLVVSETGEFIVSVFNAII